MKKTAGILVVIMFVSGFSGCQNKQQKQTASGAYDLYEAYLTVNEDILSVNDFQFIDLADQYWINELNLTIDDMPNGYYIYDPSEELLTFTLTDETRYNFYDTEAQFLSADDEDRLYTTTNLDDFLAKFDTDGNGDLGKTPFEIQVLADGQVLSIREIFVN